jgi:hypothetical protein
VALTEVKIDDVAPELSAGGQSWTAPTLEGSHGAVRVLVGTRKTR